MTAIDHAALEAAARAALTDPVSGGSLLIGAARLLALLEERKRLLAENRTLRNTAVASDERATAAEAERDRLRAALAETAAQVIAEMVRVARAALAGGKEPTNEGA